MEEHKIIYLQPICDKCAGDILKFDGRMWCEDDQGACEDCGKHWVKYKLVENDNEK